LEVADRVPHHTHTLGLHWCQRQDPQVLATSHDAVEQVITMRWMVVKIASRTQWLLFGKTLKRAKGEDLSEREYAVLQDEARRSCERGYASHSSTSRGPLRAKGPLRVCRRPVLRD
jgi:hypothetical protein